VERTGRVQCWETALYGGPAHVVEGLAGAVSVAVGIESGCASGARGSLSCWKQFRGAAEEKYKAKAGPVPSARSLAMFGERGCAVLDDGSGACWGDPDWKWPALADSAYVAGGEATWCALSTAGVLSCWDAGSKLAPALVPWAPAEPPRALPSPPTGAPP